jgi:integrase
MSAKRRTKAPSARRTRQKASAGANDSSSLELEPIPFDAFESIANRYIQNQKRRLTQESLGRVWKIIHANLIPFFGGQRKMAALTSKDIAGYIAYRSQRVSPASVHKEVGVIRNICQHAVEANLADKNPALAVVRPKIPRPDSPRCLMPEELAKILEAAPGWLQEIIKLSLYCGLRRGEITSLCWADIVGNELHVRQTRKLKGRHSARVVPLSQSAIDVLEAIRPNRPSPSEPVFPRPPATEANISQQFLRACRRAGIKEFSFQHLRHTAIEWMSRGGVGLNVLSEYMGHEDPRSTVRYVKATDAALSDALDLLERSAKRRLPAKRGSTPNPPKD